MKVKELKKLLENVNEELDVHINAFHPEPQRFGQEFPDGFEVLSVENVPANGIFGPVVWMTLGKDFKY
jgi:hypothetical protein